MKFIQACIFIIPLIFSTSVLAANYYVSPDGLNSNDGLSPESPFQSIQHAHNQTLPGDTVFIMEGTFAVNRGHILLVTRAGSLQHPIVYKNYEDHKPKLFAAKNSACWAIIRIEASHIVIDGLELEGDNPNITLQDGEEVHDHYLEAANVNWDFVASTNTNGIYVIGDRQTHIGPTHVTIRNCYIHDVPGGGISAEESDYIIIEHNVIHSTAWYMIWAGSGISFFHPFDSDNNTAEFKNIVRHNVTYDNETKVKWADVGRYSDGNGIIIDDTRNTQTPHEPYLGSTLVYNNISYNNGGMGINIYSSENTLVVNNTIYNNNRSPHLNYPNLGVGSCRNVIVQNNLVYSSPEDRNNSNSNNQEVEFRNNLFYQGSRATDGINSIIGEDPQFVDIASGDFRVKANSPAIDAGIPENAPKMDYDGNPRPQRGRPDIGAFEFLGTPMPQGETSSVPSKNYNLVRNSYFSEGKSQWQEELFGSAQAQFEIIEEGSLINEKSIEIDISNTSDQAWHVQLFQEGISLEEGKEYTFSFMAKADGTRNFYAAVQEVGNAWELFFEEELTLSEEAQIFEFHFVQPIDNTNTKVAFFMGLDDPSITLDGIRLRERRDSPEFDGLLGQYWENDNLEGSFQVERVDQTLSLDFGTFEPVEGISADGFSVRWSAYLKPDLSGLYTFQFSHKDGARLWLDSEEFVDAWEDGAREHEFSMLLMKDDYYPLLVELFNSSGASYSELSWSINGSEFERVPAASFFHSLPEEAEEQEALDAPTFLPSPGQFDDPIEVRIRAANGYQVYYTFDGSEPSQESIMYLQPFTIEESSTIKAAAFRGFRKSDVVEGQFLIGATTFFDQGPKAAKLRFYPNPVSAGESLTIVLEDSKFLGNSLSIWDLSGKIVYEKEKVLSTQEELPIGLSPGLYILKISEFRNRLIVK